MSTTKRRINISLPADLDNALSSLAKRDHMPQATKAIRLLETVLEIEEDRIWNRIAEERRKTSKKMLTHEQVWNK